MYEIWSELERLRPHGEDDASKQQVIKPAALATVIKVEGSSLRPTGSKMAMTTTNEVAGSVTGGCVESAVYEEAQEVMLNHQPKRLKYGVSDGTAWSVGLACGGSIEVFVESLSAPAWSGIEPRLRQAIAQSELVALVTVVGISAPEQQRLLGNKLLVWPDGSTAGSLDDTSLAIQAIGSAQNQLDCRAHKLVSIQHEAGPIELFIDILAPMPRLVIVGAVHIAIPLVSLARAMNYHTIVVDARSAFATRKRFPHAGELIVDWPGDALQKLHIDASTNIVCLSHDGKFDNPALQIALASPARYVGALGSRHTHAARLDELRELGISEDALARIHAPVGIDLHAVEPEEIALSIMAEIVAVRRGC